MKTNKVGIWFKENGPALKGFAIDVGKMVVTTLVVTAVIAGATIAVAMVAGFVESKLDPEGFAAEKAAEQNSTEEI